MRDIIVLEGQTGTGKSDIAYEVCKHCNGEIISADSRQIFRGADIGTNKTIFSDITTHLIDIRNIDETYNAYQFKIDALKKIEEIIKIGHTPVIVGGTSFYIDVLTGRVTLPQLDDKFIEYLTKRKEELSSFDTLSLQNLLKTLNEDLFNKLNNSELHNKYRLIKHIVNTEYYKKDPPQNIPVTNEYNYIEIGIKVPEDILKKKIHKRIDEMFERGLKEEVIHIIKDFGTRNIIAKTIGYSEFIEFDQIKELDDNTLDKIKQKIYLDTWHYAKRQMTWLKKNQNIQWVEKKDDLSNKVIFEVIKKIC